MWQSKDRILELIYILIYVVISSSGVLLVKTGSENTHLILQSSGIEASLSLKFITGLLLYILSFLLFIFKIVTLNQLSIIYPAAVGMGLIATFVLSIVLLKETVTIEKIIGFVMITIGCVLMNLSA